MLTVRVFAIEPYERWYNVRLVCRLRPEVSWHVTRRFSQFDALRKRLREEVASDSVVPALPPKHLPAMMSEASRQRRTIGLQVFCHEVLSSPALLGTSSVQDFFDLDFGLWQLRGSPLPPPMLDAAQEHGIRVLQMHTRQMLERFHQRSDQRHVASAQTNPLEQMWFQWFPGPSEDQIATPASET